MAASTENWVEYRVYPGETRSRSAQNAMEATEDPAEELLALSAHIRAETDPHTQRYLWQKAAFSLEIEHGMSNVPGHLHGLTEFGDNIMDEWFIVYLLMQLSAKFPDLVISVCDNDGEFLLIEAAEHLPNWLKPESVQHRVFIHRGALHVIPIPQTPAHIGLFPVNLTAARAVEIVRAHHALTVSAPAIQKALNDRMAGFPDRAFSESEHMTRCVLPLPVAVCLRRNPQLVAPAVEAFYNRDTDMLQKCVSMDRFPPTPAVAARVRFTRCQYSQLVCQRFPAPPKFNMPVTTHPMFAASELGMKLACGFEMMYQNDKEFLSGTPAEEGSQKKPQDLESALRDPRWQKFHQSLSSRNYYQGEIEGSKLYKELQSKAFQYYTEEDVAGHSSSRGIGTGGAGGAFARAVDALCASELADKSVEEVAGTFPTYEKLPADHRDDWMHVTNDELESMLNMYNMSSLGGAGGGPNPNPNTNPEGNPDPAAAAPSPSDKSAGASGSKTTAPRVSQPFRPAGMPEERLDLDELVKGVNSFVSTISSHEGVEVAKELAQDDSIVFDIEKYIGLMKSVVGDDASGIPEPTPLGSDHQAEDLLSDDSSSDGGDDSSDGGDDSPDEDCGDDDPGIGKVNEEIAQMMSAMDSQLKGSSMGASFEFPDGAGDSDSDNEDRPMDLDFNLVKNMLKSYSAQDGLSGPVSSILGQLNLHLPGDDPRDE